AHYGQRGGSAHLGGVAGGRGAGPSDHPKRARIGPRAPASRGGGALSCLRWGERMTARTAFRPPSNPVWRASEPPLNRVQRLLEPGSSPSGGGRRGEGSSTYLALKPRFPPISVPEVAGRATRYTPGGCQNGLFLNEIMGRRTAQTPF